MSARPLLSLACLALLSGCATLEHPSEPAAADDASTNSWEEILSRPGVIKHRAVVSARWSVPLSGLLNLDHPKAEEAGLTEREEPIALLVHALEHPEHGLFVVDTGVPQAMVNGERGPVRGLVGPYTSDLKPTVSLAQITAEVGRPLAGVLLTHLHVDHILGLPDVPSQVPVYVGPGGMEAERIMNLATRRTTQAAFEGRSAVRVWEFESAPEMPMVGKAIDVLGDGTLWAIAAPGHTPGTTAYLALTTEGPRLFVGDVSHTRWGWEHGVEPGSFTDDQEKNRETLQRLKAFADKYDIPAYVGHEL